MSTIDFQFDVQDGCLMGVGVTGCPSRSGKVRTIVDLGENILIIATDRISAYDVVMPNGIPDKGRVLTQLSLMWTNRLRHITDDHLISTSVSDLPKAMRRKEFIERVMLCRKAAVVPIECIVRGYLAGSAFKEYRQKGTACGIELPKGLQQCSQLPEPIFTPSTKAEAGHDENIGFEEMRQRLIAIYGPEGNNIAIVLRARSIELYKAASEFAATKGILLADTKFEWGRLPSGKIILIDEVLTPDSSRFWPASLYQPGRDQPSFDKQFVRDWLDSIKFNRQPPGPILPPDIVQKTRQKYLEAHSLLTGSALRA